MTGIREWAGRNRPATTEELAHAVRVARRLADEYVRNGATAVVLSGSWARRNAHRWSDLDLWVLGRRPRHSVTIRDGFLVSVKHTTAGGALHELSNPPRLGQAVQAWREAVVLRDPRRAARGIKAAATAFRWRSVAARCDRYISGSLAEWGEEVLKVTRHARVGEWESAAVQRNMLADALAGLMALHQRLLFDENELWRVVGRRMGAEWHRTQKVALGVTRGSLRESCEASVRLYCLSARAASGTLNGRDRDVVAHVCERVGIPLDPTASGPAEPHRGKPRATREG